MIPLLEEIQADINWRISEIVNIKTIPIRYKLIDSHKKTLILYAVPSMYSLWEGFLKNTFVLFTNYLNNLCLDPKMVHINLLTHAVDTKCKLGDARKHFEKKTNLVEMISEIYNSAQLHINQEIPTGSNANYKITNVILQRFNIEPLDEKYEAKLDKFLLFRNKIAHGENSIMVTMDDVDIFSLLVENLMYEILLLIESSVENAKYKTHC